MDIPTASTIRNNLEEIEKAGHRAKDLVKQILTFSRQTETQPVAVELTQIVKESLKLLRATLPTTIEIRQGLHEHAGKILADPTQMQQVVMNLCTNAAQAMQKTRRVLEVALEPVHLDESAVKDLSNMTPGNYVMLRVSDTGDGIKPDIIDKIFDPFFTTKPTGEGTGMGLAVVHGIVQNHGGAIAVESEPGKGTSFKVFLPQIEEKADRQTEETVIGLLAGNERILFVDDEVSIVRLGEQMLQRLGYHVESRTSSIEALAAFQARPDQYDLVITDMTMPNMTGDVLAKELLKIRSDIPVILCTGFSQQVDQEKALGQGIRAFIMKPFVISHVAQTIRKILDTANQNEA